MNDDVAEREGERQPVLVEGEQDDDHEEVEVRLDLAVPRVNQQRGGGEQTERDEHRARTTADPGRRGEHGEPRQGHAVQQCVPEGLSLGQQPEERQTRDVEPQEREQPAMALLPRVLGQRPPVRQHRPNGHETTANRCDRRVHGMTPGAAIPLQRPRRQV